MRTGNLVNKSDQYKPDFFWLHIKKSAGSSCMHLLKPNYISIEKKNKCPSFIQSDQKYWNDILNNSRIMIGEYQFKRSLFAKKYLYPDNWDNLFSFAFSREPVSRTISMFYYLFFKHNKWDHQGILERTKKSLKYKRIVLNHSTMFDLFLDAVEGTRDESVHISKHFATHTASMFDDVTDEKGNVILKEIYKLDSMVPAIKKIYEELNLPINFETVVKANENKNKGLYKPNRNQLSRIEKLFGPDFEIYENALYV